MRRLFVFVSVLTLVSAGWVAAPAATRRQEPVKSVVGTSQGVSVSSHLVAAMDLAAEGTDTAAIQAEVPIVTFVDSLVEVELRFDRLDAATVAAAEAAGLQVTGAHLDVGFLNGAIALDGIADLVELEGLATIHPMYGATTATGSVENQADDSMRAAQARSQFGVDGTGVDIGILSDSFDGAGTGTVNGSGCNRTVSGTSSQTSGDVPASVRVIQDTAGSDEGRGMAELISDLAPGVDLSFRTAFISEADFAQGITDLVDCGSNVIVDDVIYFAEPMFQDGVVAQAAQAAADAGVPYFSSAGNQGTFGVTDSYEDFGDRRHDFGGNDRFARVRLDPGEGVLMIMQWNDPFDGTLGDGAINDFDIYLLDAADPAANLLAASAGAQGCGIAAGTQAGDPLEGLSYQNTTGSQQDVFVVVDRFCSAAGGGNYFRIATYGLTSSITSLGFEGDIFTDAQQYGHAVAKDARSVAAVFYGEIDDPTVDPPNNQTNVEPFSSLGGNIPIYFDGSGNTIPGGPELRHKPEMAAADGTNTTFFGSDIGFDADAFPNFFGTSAAAPHAAAVAALLLDRAPDFTPAGVYFQLQNTAIDIETNGVDNLSGYGLVDAVDALSNLPDLECDGQAATIIGTDGPDVIDGTSAKDVIVSLGGADIVNGKGGNDVICLGNGNDVGNGGNGNDRIFGQKGKDTLAGDDDDDNLMGGSGVDTADYSGAAAGVTVNLANGTGNQGSDTLASIENVDGSPFKDTLKGDGGANVLRGMGGNDTLDGKGGADTLIGSGGKDDLDGGSGKDTLKGGGGNDTLDGGSGNDEIAGGGGDDVGDGGVGNDEMNGNSGRDAFDGGDGMDTIAGGGGGDTLRGQAGADTLRGQGGNDTLVGGRGTDTLVGGSGTDSCNGENESGCES